LRWWTGDFSCLMCGLKIKQSWFAFGKTSWSSEPTDLHEYARDQSGVSH
jgi:hypothetical protein